jgi:hypothetical protein
MDRILNSNFIIISGSGKKVGKTYLAVALIRHFSVQSPVIALKISPHKHDKLGKVLPIADKAGYRLFRELEVHDKNSGQFLEAGAKASFFLETEDGFLGQAIEEFLIKCNPMKLPVICESGALGTIIKPGILLYISDPESQSDQYKETIKQIADEVLPARKFSTSEVVRSIQLAGNCWIRKNETAKQTDRKI